MRNLKEGVDGGYGINSFQLAHNTADAASLVTAKLESKLRAGKQKVSPLFTSQTAHEPSS